MNAYPGIDYSLGRSNFDPETGIHFGVISSHSLGDGFYDAQEMDYGTAHCPKCGNDAIDIPCHTVQHENGVSVIQDIPEAYEEYESAKHECSDYACESCRYLFGSESAFSEEPLGWSIDDGAYKVVNCLDSDAMILKAPYYTYAQYCSPCVPGAGNIETPVSEDDGGVKCYAFGHDWYDGNTAPYPVYSVETGALVPAELAA